MLEHLTEDDKRALLWQLEDDPDGPWRRENGEQWVPGASLPPERHPWRCHAVKRNGGAHRCKLWSVRDRPYCKYHGGRYHGPAPKTEKGRGIHRMYRTHLRPAAVAVFDAYLKHERPLELYEEIALARTDVEESLKLAAVVEKCEGVKFETRMASLTLVRDAVQHVADLCSRMARIEKDLEDGVHMRHIASFVDDVMVALREELGSRDPRVMRIADALRERALELQGRGEGRCLEIDISK